MKLFKKIIVPISGIIICAVVFLKANAGFFGLLINELFPCVQSPMNSFPCFGIYDVEAMVIASVLGLTLIGVVIFRVRIFLRGK